MMSDDEEAFVDPAASKMMKDDVNFGAFVLSVVDADPYADGDEGLELHVINKEEMAGFAFRCDGRIRPVQKGEAVRKVLGRDE